MRAHLLISGLVSVLAASGCSGLRVVMSDAPPLPIDPLASPPDGPNGLGQVCVIRPHSIGALLTIPVRDNGLLVGATQGPSYFCYFAQPGLHRITMQLSGELAVDAQVDSGRTLYLHQHIRIGADRFYPISAEAARPMLERCDYSQLVEAHAEELLAEAPARPRL